MVPLTSNIDQRHSEKSRKYAPFLTDITEDTTTVNCFEISSTGFITNSNRSTLSTLHLFMRKDLKRSTFLSNLNALAWYGSYKIWLTRDEPIFVDPPFLIPHLWFDPSQNIVGKLDTASAEILSWASGTKVLVTHYLDVQLLQTSLFSIKMNSAVKKAVIKPILFLNVKYFLIIGWPHIIIILYFQGICTIRWASLFSMKLKLRLLFIFVFCDILLISYSVWHMLSIFVHFARVS